MGAAFLITLREGLEAALIVAIVMAYLRQVGRAGQFGWGGVGAEELGGVGLGARGGVAVSLAAGAGVYLAVGELEGRAEQLTEGIIALVAVGVLTWMIFWMRQQARTIGAALRSEVDRAMATGAMFGLVSLLFFFFLSQVLETALFFLPL